MEAGPMLCDKLDKSDLPFFLSAVGDKWIAEIKEDGDRIRLRIKDGVLTLFNRAGKDVTFKYPELHNLYIPTTHNDEQSVNVFLDGEMCVMDKDGVSEFNDGITHRSHLHSVSQEDIDNYPITFIIFDLLEIDNQDIRDKPWEYRRGLLEDLQLEHPNIIISEGGK